LLETTDILGILQQRCRQGWLVNYDNQAFYDLTLEFYQQFSQIPHPAKILLVEANPDSFLAAFLAGVSARHWLFLGTYQWGDQEWNQVLSLVQPDLIWGYSLQTFPEQISPLPYSLPASPIMIPTGGTSGKIRFAIHSWKTLQASVQGFQSYFNLHSVNSFCVLPLYHVSGLMQFLRSFLTGGRFYISPYQSLKVSPPELGNFQNYFISLVPTQLQFLLDFYPQWLAGFQTVLLGGAPAETSLLEKARKFAINLSPTYGMTETASQIATLKSGDFLQGNNSNGRVLPHGNITIKDEQIIINSKSLFLGYYPQLLNQSAELITDDLGYFDEDGYLYILGRKSQVIITGGEKVFPQEVESTSLETELFKDVVIMGLPDTYWGQVVVGVYVPKYPELSLGDIQRAMGNKLAKFKQPKHWIKLDSIPRNQQGKINYTQLRKTVQSLYENQ